MIIFDGLLKISAKILINILLIELLIFVFRNCRETIKEMIQSGFEWLRDFFQRRRES